MFFSGFCIGISNGGSASERGLHFNEAILLVILLQIIFLCCLTYLMYCYFDFFRCFIAMFFHFADNILPDLFVCDFFP